MLTGAMAAVPAMTMDMYLPSMPIIARELMTTQSMVQGTVSAILIGGAVGQLVNGPISDRFGRRLPFFIGMSLHVAMSIAIMFAGNLYWLLGLRLLQGIGNASATVAAMAVLRDRFSGPAVAAGISRNMMVVSVAPIIAPSIGGFIATHWGWRGVFAVLGAIGLALMVGAWAFLPETHPAHRRTTTLRIFSSYTPLLRDFGFMRLALVPSFTMVVLMAYVSSASFIYQETFGLSAAQFALVFALNGLGMIVFAQLNSRLVYRLGSHRILWRALATEIALAAALLVLALAGAVTWWVFALATFLLLAVNTMTMPNGAALALADQGKRAGTATALMGAMQAGMGGALAPLVGVLGGDTTALAIVALAALLVAAALLATARRA